MSAYLFYLGAVLIVTVPCAAMYCGRYDSTIKTHIFNPAAHSFILLVLCFFFALSPLASLWFVLTPLALSIVALSCQTRQVSVSTARWTIGAAALAITLVPAASVTSLMWRIQSGLSEFPLISLTDRLAYEADARTEIDSVSLRNAVGDLRYDRTQKGKTREEHTLPLASNVSAESLERLERKFEVTRDTLVGNKIDSSLPFWPLIEIRRLSSQTRWDLASRGLGLSHITIGNSNSPQRRRSR